jgi:hypothetical protein
MNKIHLLTVFYLIQPSSKQIICFDFEKQNGGLPKVFYVPWFWVSINDRSTLFNILKRWHHNADVKLFLSIQCR